MLLRLRRTRMFAVSHVDGFVAIMHKRATLLMQRVRGGSTGVMNIIAGSVQSSFLEHWTKPHMYTGPSNYSEVVNYER